MSVINKMLRDLDARQAKAAEPAGADSVRATQGLANASTHIAQTHSRPSRVLRWLVGLLVLVSASAAAWYYAQGFVLMRGRMLLQSATVVAPVPMPVPVASEPAVAVSVPATATVVVAMPAVPVEVVSAPAVPATVPVPTSGTVPSPSAAAMNAVDLIKAIDQVSLRMEDTLNSERLKGRSVAQVVTKSKKSSVAPATAPAPAAKAVQPKAAAPAASSHPANSSTAGTPTLQQQRQAAAQETLGQAQSLWAAGSRETALELMRDAVAAAQRAQNPGTGPDASMLAPLVRELVRMEMALGRVNRALDLLTRLEPVLSDQPDLWAMRGNAAQRLARHQEAVLAYLKALDLRPDEPRWMLGAAVSLAALGKVEAASAQAEKARLIGGEISPEIMSYLRQAGVLLK